MGKRLLILGLLLLIFSPAWANDKLVVRGPESYYSGGKKIYVDRDKKLGVSLTYGGLKVQANQASVNGVIELSQGFRGSYDKFYFEGEYLRLNPATGTYAGEDIKFGYLGAYLQGKSFQFFGDKISARQVTASPFYYPVFNLSSDELDIYPDYTLARRNTLRFFAVPFYYVPLYFNDSRPSSFELPFPALELKKDVFHDKHGAVHTHYFINPALFGDFSLHLSDRDGGGAAVQHIYRLSDQHQFELRLLGWQRSPAQAKFSYAFTGVQPKVTVGVDYSVNEEIKRSVIDRYPDLHLSLGMQGNLYDHVYTLTPSVAYGKIREKKIYPEDLPAQDVDRAYERSKAGVNFTYFLETPYVKPYINKVLWGVDYEHSAYDPGSLNRGRFSSSITVRRPIYEPFGLFYEAVLTKILADYGQSPFFFEEYGRLKDSGTLDLFLQSSLIIAGAQLVSDFSAGQLYNEVYYMGIKAMDNYAVLKHDRRMQSWEFAFMRKETAF